MLIDAPCSGEGMFRKDPAVIKTWEEERPEYFAKLQKDILKMVCGCCARVENCCIPPVPLLR